ncbi:hypothetical protein BUALT_Bualt06G0033000 [Buddleja alternifolia]|uniref:CCDC22 coiled-coil domain-containing protein n=1 Tax=Buddleja alternifolia TaxID=168488 RepID=A0AAV6XDQ2_9LAMI|nr:hypothetical protein BUALT_Bualt06G0033000 [Buddleja alternifolia]
MLPSSPFDRRPPPPCVVAWIVLAGGFHDPLRFNHDELLRSQMTANSPELQHVDEELALLKAAVDMVFDGQHPIEYYIEQLNDQVEAKRCKLKELESEWDAIENLCKRRKQTSSSLSLPLSRGEWEAFEKQRNRGEELCKLSSDLEKQPKLAPRRSYIERVNEITKNSRKQDTDIQQILKDTRELQLGGNTIQERLNRTYAIVDEKISGKPRKILLFDKLTGFSQTSMRALNRLLKRFLPLTEPGESAADYETKLAFISARSLNMSKLQADLDVIRKENDPLDQCIHNN